jgi:hypothetical protein
VTLLLQRTTPKTSLECSDENVCRNDSGTIVTMAVEGGAMQSETFRLQAERCRRLAKSIYNSEVAANLEAYAHELELRATALEVSVNGIFSDLAESRTGLLQC